MEDNIIGIDLAKNIFHVCVMNRAGKVKQRRKVRRSQLLNYVVNHCKGIIAMEACGGSNYWARQFEGSGFEVRQIAAQFVKPFVKSNKNDVIDAEAICEAASRERMRFISTRSEEQQDIQNLHRIRERLVRRRTALSNEMRGLLMEYGITIPKGIGHVRKNLHELLEQHKAEHSALWYETFMKLYDEFCSLDIEIEHYEKRLEGFAKSSDVCKRLKDIPGVGTLTATAIVAAVGNPKDFKNGRQFSAWLGLVPRQYTTGGKPRLGRISKRGDSYLRKLIIQGSHACARWIVIKKKQDCTSRWFMDVAHRRGDNRALIALANKTARRIWVVLAKGENFKQPEELLPLAA